MLDVVFLKKKNKTVHIPILLGFFFRKYISSQDNLQVYFFAT